MSDYRVDSELYGGNQGWVDGQPMIPKVDVNNPKTKLPVDYTSALATQSGGSHYKNKGIQPIQYIHASNLGFCEGNIVKYVTRWKDKGGFADLEKIKHYVDLLIELEGDTE